MSQPRFTTTVSILSISMVGGVSTIITGIIPQLEHAYPQMPTTMIEWLVTAANFSALATLLLNPKLTYRYGSRSVVITGLLIAAWAGVIPLLIKNFTLIMVSRLALGLGVGLFLPHAIGLIAHVYTGEFRTRLLGYQTGLSALGNALLLALAGVMVALNWRSVFLIYLLLGVVAVGVWRFVPAVGETDTHEHVRSHLNNERWCFIRLAFITYLLIWGVQLKLPSLFLTRGFGDASVVNWTLAAMNIGGLIAGLSFGLVYRRLRQYTLVLGYGGAAVSVAVLLLAKNQVVAILAAVFFNYIYSYTGPYLVFRSNLGLADDQVDTLSSYLTIATVISAFFAPVVWNFLGNLGPNDVTGNALLWVTGSLLVITGCIWIRVLQPHMEKNK
ncbi:MFS transporter [Sporolactobacillus sp. CPB3-1]|uniref:MFS transporter n=1 Tax=Sporolactobacillus mangiferae TaxID=2940498 RepID=A0ABT0M9C5_9BACL|nr:MFS transporter [Sporolactobacillus mangiferae]MCL1631454.1 MFS transporter [Sporolactobacillus mangiferae]